MSGQPPEERVEAQALRGVPWSVLAYGAARGISLVGTLALARLLTPSDIGVFFTGMVVVGAVNLFSDTGLGTALVVRDDLGERMLGTIFVCMTAVSVAMAGIGAALSGVLADLLNSPRLADILPVLAITAVFSTIGFFFLSVLQRALL